MSDTPIYLQGTVDLANLGYTDLHDPGQTAFAHVKMMQRVTNGPHLMTISWGSCRDGVQQIADNLIAASGLFFSHRAERSLDCTNFLLQIERKLMIEPSVYQLTPQRHITWVRPNPWWYSSFMRKSFYTLMLRCSYSYTINQNNFDAALWSIDYTKQTRPAVEKFLKGYTVYDYKPTDHTDGWFKQFHKIQPGTNSFPATFDLKGNVANIAKLRPGSELISSVAHKKWLQRGGDTGYDKEDWYNAEQELLKEAS